MPDDYLATTQTTGRVSVDGTATGRIETSGDRDWFAVELEAGTTYRIDLEGSRTRAGTLLNPYLRGIHDANGDLLPGTANDEGGYSHNSRVYFTATQNATHYVAAGAFGSDRGTYTLSVTDVGDDGVPDDFAAGTGTGGTVAVGGSSTGEIELVGDRDWFAVELEAGKIYRIDLEGSSTDAGTLSDPYLRGIYDANGNLIFGMTDNNGGTGNNSRVYFTATENAIYYVAAGARGAIEGTYTLSVTDVTDSVRDDFAARTGTSGAVAVGGSSTGEIEFSNDRDWFAVELEAGKSYRIDLEGWSTWAGTLFDPYLRGIHDADGDLLPGTASHDDGAYLNARVDFTATENATHYVAAGGVGNGTGTYILSVTEIVDDYAAGTGTGGTVAIGGSSTGEIEAPGDRDWFAVMLEADKTYRIDLEGSPTWDGTLYDPFLRGVYDANGNLISGTADNNGGTGNNSRVNFTATENATHYVAAGADGNRTGTYTLSVTEIVDDYAAGTGTSGSVTVGGSATGRIEPPNDRDWFAVALEAGREYRIDLEGSRTGAGTLYDPFLRGVYDANGNLITGTTDNSGGTGNNSRVYFTATENATHYVAAGANGNRTGTYTLSVTENADDDYAAGTGTSGAVTVGGSSTGEIESPNDRDWFAADLVAGKTYRIDLEGSRTGAGTLYDPYLRGVYDANGDRISGTTDNNDGYSYNSRVYFTATENATHYVAAGANGNRTGTYTLSVTEDADDDYAAGTGTSGAVTVGGSSTGEIESPNDRDWFAVELVAGRDYRIDLEGSRTGAGTLFDPYLRGIHDANGDRISGTTDNNDGYSYNSRVYFTATENATHYVAAGANGNRTGTYTLSVTEIVDDYAAGTGTSGAVAVGGSSTGEIESPHDRDWFAVELVAGRDYRIDLEGSRTRAGTLSDPYLRGIHDANGDRIAGTTNDDGGAGYNSRVGFTATENATYYVAAGAYRSGEGTYTLSVEEVM